jgi:hypothetical protein
VNRTWKPPASLRRGGLPVCRPTSRSIASAGALPASSSLDCPGRFKSGATAACARAGTQDADAECSTVIDRELDEAWEEAYRVAGGLPGRPVIQGHDLARGR